MVAELEQAEMLLEGPDLPPELDRLFCHSGGDVEDATGTANGSNDDEIEPVSKKVKVAKQEDPILHLDCVRARIIVLCNDGSDGLIYPLEET